MTLSAPKSVWSPRQSIAFCFGLTLLPIFWVWWMASPRFSRVHRGLALVWTGVWLTGIAVTWPLMQPSYAELLWTYPYLCALVTICLAALLILRFGNWLDIAIIWFVFGGVAHHFVDAFLTSAGEPRNFLWWALTLIAFAALNLIPAHRSSEDNT